MRILVAALVAMAIGCGSGGGTPRPDRFTGLWFLDLGSGCFETIAFSNNTEYELHVACSIDARTLGMEIEAGSYTVNGNQMTWFPTLATCDGNPDRVFGVSVSGDNLSVAAGTDILIHHRLTGGAGPTDGITIRLGCWQNDGTLAPHPLDPPR